MRTLAEKLTELIARTPHPTERRPFTDQEIAAETGLSHTQVWNLKTGRQADPKKSTIVALAAFFRVAPGYLLTDEVEIEDALVDAGVALIATRAAGLSPDGLRTVMSVLEHVRRLEQQAETRASD